MKKASIFSIIGLCIIGWLVIAQPFADDTPKDANEENFTEVLYAWGDRQSEQSDKIVDAAAKPVEGKLVGEHEVDGSNWAIPNIIRHWMGVD